MGACLLVSTWLQGSEGELHWFRGGGGGILPGLEDLGVGPVFEGFDRFLKGKFIGFCEKDRCIGVTGSHDLFSLFPGEPFASLQSHQGSGGALGAYVGKPANLAVSSWW